MQSGKGCGQQIAGSDFHNVQRYTLEILQPPWPLLIYCFALELHRTISIAVNSVGPILVQENSFLPLLVDTMYAFPYPAPTRSHSFIKSQTLFHGAKRKSKRVRVAIDDKNAQKLLHPKRNCPRETRTLLLGSPGLQCVASWCCFRGDLAKHEKQGTSNRSLCQSLSFCAHTNGWGP